MSSKTIDIHDTQTSLSDLVSLALEGNEVIIAENDKPVARLIPISESKPLCIPGLNRGEIWTSEDFDDLVLLGYGVKVLW
jgi:antitoxin (DNA-binding transcriptional repressor) of toxin-antitoxin stability system